ncbi:hypothetical protein GUJ93_ZPchr0013g34074 [Zizania palustris]|uniref:Uncharacterized protein n=1 Tax=Zizania palustris TaxID=103762 RepID=A0A8J5WV03_ZIZPA|nr:hypothetical protein GUJ93_ZPchr0013g34074 [Zizania palustris]
MRSTMESMNLECGNISASQEALLARSSFLRDRDDDDVFSTPPTTQEDVITMCTLSFTQSQSTAAVVAPFTTHGCSFSEDGQDDEVSSIVKQRCRPSVCTGKVRSAKVRTPTPSPDGTTTTEGQHNNGDPLYKAVLMIPTKESTPGIPVDFLALARQRGFL